MGARQAGGCSQRRFEPVACVCLSSNGVLQICLNSCGVAPWAPACFLSFGVASSTGYFWRQGLSDSVSFRFWDTPVIHPSYGRPFSNTLCCVVSLVFGAGRQIKESYLRGLSFLIRPSLLFVSTAGEGCERQQRSPTLLGRGWAGQRKKGWRLKLQVH